MLRQRLIIANRLLSGCTLLLVICGCAVFTESAENRRIKAASVETQAHGEQHSDAPVIENNVNPSAAGNAPTLQLLPPRWPRNVQPADPFSGAEWQYGNFNVDELEPAAGPEPTYWNNNDQSLYGRDEVRPSPIVQLPATYQTTDWQNPDAEVPLYSPPDSTYDRDGILTSSPWIPHGEITEVSYGTGATAGPEPTAAPTLDPTDPLAAAAAALALKEARDNASSLAEAQVRADAAAAAVEAAKQQDNDGLADASIRLDYEGDYIVNQSRSVVLSVGYGLDQASLAAGVKADLARLGHVDGKPLTDDLRLNPAAVTAELTGDAGAFKITSGPNKTRALLFGKPNQWQWDVKPLLEGPQQLTLTLSWPLPGATDGRPQVFQRAYQVAVSVDTETFWSNLIGKITDHSKKLTAMFVALLALIAAAIKLLRTLRTGKENG